MTIVLDRVDLKIGGEVVIEDVSLTLGRGLMNVLLVPTLAYKTTLMCLIVKRFELRPMAGHYKLREELRDQSPLILPGAGFRRTAATLSNAGPASFGFPSVGPRTHISGSESLVNVGVGVWVCLVSGVHDWLPGSTREVFVDPTAQRKLSNEKPPGETIDYDKLNKTWAATTPPSKKAKPNRGPGQQAVWSGQLCCSEGQC